jgi:hypothetical protein
MTASSRWGSSGFRKYSAGVRSRMRCCSLRFSRTSGVVKVGALMPVKSWVHRSSSGSSFKPGTPITLTEILRIPLSSRSAGAAGPGPAKRTQAG